MSAETNNRELALNKFELAMGSFRAGNEDGTIPEWTGGITTPPPGYEPRASDPRAGYIPLVYEDYAAPLGEPIALWCIPPSRISPVCRSCAARTT